MASTFDNDLRLEEMATGENAGSWGTKTNTNLELIADAFGYGTFTIADADTTLTMPDGSDTDNALRSLYLKISSSADLTTTRTLTLAPNSVSKLWYIENNTSGGQTITISQGSGANVSILNGQAKLVATDGAGAGAAVIDATQDLAIPDLFIDDDLSLQSDGAIINFGADADVSLTHVADTGLRLNAAMALEFRDGDLSINSSADGQLDIDADTKIEITSTNVDIDGIINVGEDDTGYDVKFFGATSGKYMLWDESADTLEVEGNLTVDTNTLYVDSANDRVGINTSPATVLDVYSTTGDSDGILRVYQNTATSNPTMQVRQRGEGGSIGTTQGLLIDMAGHNSGLGYAIKATTTNSNLNGGVAFNTFALQNGGTFNFWSGGVVNENGNDSDFRVESDSNTHMLFVDAGNNRVSVGTNDTPSVNFTVADSMRVQAYGGTDAFINLAVGATAASPDQIYTIRIDNDQSDSFEIDDNTDGSEFFRYTPSVGIILNDESKGDNDFRVESDNQTHALFVDAGNDRVGIGSSSPDTKLDLFLGTTTSGDYITTGNTNRFGNGLSKLITFKHGYNTPREVAAIAVNTSSNSPNIDGRGDLYFYTGTSGASDAGSTSTQRLRIDYAGNVIFNDTGTTADFRVESDSNTHMLFVDAGANHVNIGTSSDFGGVLNVAGVINQNRLAGITKFTDLSADIVQTANNNVVFTSGSGGTTQRTSVALWANDHSQYSGQIHLVGNTSNGGSVNSAGEVEFWTFNGSSYTLESYMGPRGYVFNEASRNVDFRVESDGKANMLFVDAGQNTVNVNTTSTDATINVESNTNSDTGYPVNIKYAKGIRTHNISGGADGTRTVRVTIEGQNYNPIHVRFNVGGIYYNNGANTYSNLYEFTIIKENTNLFRNQRRDIHAYGSGVSAAPTATSVSSTQFKIELTANTGFNIETYVEAWGKGFTKIVNIQNV